MTKFIRISAPVLIAVQSYAVAAFGQEQQPVSYLGAFDSIGSEVSVTPLSEDRLRFCVEKTAGQSDCASVPYTVGDGIARFAIPGYGSLAFDLVTNVLELTETEGKAFSADMTPVNP